jgi:hypothetical protein
MMMSLETRRFAMRVLVVGTLPEGMRRGEERLGEAGHEVVRCHEPGDPSFPCAGLVEGRVCPLESGPVDVVVTARDRPWPRPSPFEDGAICALRRHVPLVVLGTAVHPFESWVTARVDDDRELVRACEDAAAASLTRHSTVAASAAQTVLERAGLDPEGAAASVRHERGRLRVELVLPPHPDQLESNIVASVLSALRQFDPHAAGIEVSIAERLGKDAVGAGGQG